MAKISTVLHKIVNPRNLTKLYIKSNLTFAKISDENFWKIYLLDQIKFKFPVLKEMNCSE